MTANLACPHCGRPAIAPLRKFLLGPATSARCAACGHKVSIPYFSAYSLFRSWRGSAQRDGLRQRIEAFTVTATTPYIAKVYRPSTSDLARNPDAPGRIEHWYP